MSKADEYRSQLRIMQDWEPFLLQHSGLPGPRGNLELAQAVADEGDRELFERLLTYEAEWAPTNDPHEFLFFCGVLGLGKLLAEGDRSVLERLRAHASDPRWRTREAVAMALQRWGTRDMGALLEHMQAWSQGTPLEMRAALAATCEPALLGDERHARQVIELLQSVTQAMAESSDRKSEAFRALRKGLGYCWSVAVAALPEAGKQAMQGWLQSEDADVRWVMRENLKKRRLERLDPAWVARSRKLLDR